MNSKHFLVGAVILIFAVVIFALLHSPADNTGAAQRADNTGEAGPVSHSAWQSNQTPARRGAHERSNSANEDVQALLDRVQHMQREIASLKRQSDPSASTPPSEEPLSAAEQEAQERERTQQTTAFLEGNFVAEEKDPSWSLQAERQVSDTFNQDEISAGSQLQQIACQATLCRIQSHHQDPTAERAFLTRIGRLDAFGDAEAFSERVERADGSIEAVTYVSRSGHRLPRIE